MIKSEKEVFGCGKEFIGKDIHGKETKFICINEPFTCPECQKDIKKVREIDEVSK
jgi:hypothetical protein